MEAEVMEEEAMAGEAMEEEAMVEEEEEEVVVAGAGVVLRKEAKASVLASPRGPAR